MENIELADISIRSTLHPGDLGYIAHLHGDLYAKENGYGLNFEAYVLEGLKDFALKYEPEKDRVWICEHNSQVVGCLVAQHRDDCMQLRYFIFRPEYRGIGLGKKLMTGFIDFMNESGNKKAYLWTTVEQEGAIALYKKFEFTLTEEKPSHAFDKPLVELRYDMELPQ